MTGFFGDRDVGNEVHAATGMIAAQLGCGIDEAMALLIIRADASSQSLEHLARDVISRRVRFDE